MKCLKCGKKTVFEVCESCQVEGNITISIKEYTQLLDYAILEKQKKQRNCQIADLKHKIKKDEHDDYVKPIYEPRRKP